MKITVRAHENPYRDPAAKPTRAQFIRLGGDSVSIRLQELRRRLGAINGVVEEIHYTGEDTGWATRYRVDESTLCTVRVLPGELEARFDADPGVAAKILHAKSVGAEVKKGVQAALDCDPPGRVLVRLGNATAVRSFGNAILIKSKSSLP